MLESQENGGRWHSQQRNVGMHPPAVFTDGAGRISVSPLCRGNGQTPLPALPWPCRHDMQ